MTSSPPTSTRRSSGSCGVPSGHSSLGRARTRPSSVIAAASLPGGNRRRLGGVDQETMDDTTFSAPGDTSEAVTGAGTAFAVEAPAPSDAADDADDGKAELVATIEAIRPA